MGLYPPCGWCRHAQVWLKFRTRDNTAIYNADGWRKGDLHFQLYSGQIQFGINGGPILKGGSLQPDPNKWYFISITLKAGAYIRLYVNGVIVSDSPITSTLMPTLNLAHLGVWYTGTAFTVSIP